MLSSQYNSHLIPAWLRKSVPHEEKESDSCGCNPRRLRPAGCWMCAARRWGAVCCEPCWPPMWGSRPRPAILPISRFKETHRRWEESSYPCTTQTCHLLHLDISQDTPKAREKNLLLALSGYSSHCFSLFKHGATWKICPHTVLKHLIRALKTFVFAAISDCI